MKAEIEMAKEQHQAHGIPVREREDGRPPAEELMMRRRIGRVEADDLLRAFTNGEGMVDLAMRMARLMFTTAGTCVQFGVTPDIAHFSEAIREQIEAAQRKLDEALRVWDPHDVRVAAIEMQNAIFALAGQTSIPYGAIMFHAHQQFLKGEPMDREAVRTILKNAGHDLSETPPAESANDGEVA